MRDFTSNGVQRLSTSDSTVITDVKAAGPLVRFSGWLSKENKDYYNTAFLAEGARDLWERYANNPIVCWNHDTKQPAVGKCEKPQIITGEGLYHEDIVLSDTEFNRNYLAPLIIDGVIKQLSLSAYVLDFEIPDPDDEFMIFTRYLLKEGSIVNIAGNHTCNVIGDSVEDLRAMLMLKVDPNRGDMAKIKTFNDLARAVQTGEVYKPVRYSIGEMPTGTDKAESMYSARAIPTKVKRIVEAEGVTRSSNLIIRQLELGDSTELYPVGIESDDTIFVDEEKLESSLCRLLGAQNPEAAMMPASVRFEAINAICAMYRALELPMPRVKEDTVVSDERDLSDLTVDQVRGLRYSDVAFKNGEDTRFFLNTTLRHIDSIDRSLNSKFLASKDEERKDDISEFNRAMEELVVRYMEISWNIHGYAYGKDSYEAMMKVMEAVADAQGYDKDPTSAISVSIDEERADEREEDVEEAHTTETTPVSESDEVLRHFGDLFALDSKNA